MLWQILRHQRVIKRGNIYGVRAATLFLLGMICCASVNAVQKRSPEVIDEAEFGPVVSAYLGYLRAQQEVVDDRVSRHEVSRTYYLRNSNRIRALRQMALRIARETENDYLPELEAATPDEFGTLFDVPPEVEDLRVEETLNFTFRYLGVIPVGREKFYLFARLDPYEQAELKKKHAVAPASPTSTQATTRETPTPEASSRPRRINSP